MQIKQAEYAYGMANPGQYKPDSLPELAFAGRSNVGKSSLLNKLLGRKLARVSGTPGHTRLIHFYRVNAAFTFADLPGYGFSRVSAAEKDRWQGLMEFYFTQSPHLAHTFLLVDIRHAPSQEDLHMIRYLSALQKPFTLVATKADKLSAAQTRKALAALSVATGVIVPDIMPVSSTTGQGREALLQKIGALLAQHAQNYGQAD